MSRETMQQAIEALPLAIFPFKSEPMLYRSDVLAALAQPEQQPDVGPACPVGMVFFHGKVIVGLSCEALANEEECETRLAIVRAAAAIGQAMPGTDRGEA